MRRHGPLAVKVTFLRFMQNPKKWVNRVTWLYDVRVVDIVGTDLARLFWNRDFVLCIRGEGKVADFVQQETGAKRLEMNDPTMPNHLRPSSPDPDAV